MEDIIKWFGYTIGGAVGLAVVIGLICLIPILTIWALNTLFGLGIPYTLQTIVAAFILQIAIKGGIKWKKKS
jgi:hypothetical protein